MLLIITNTLDPTADYVANFAEKAGIPFRRLNTNKLLLNGYALSIEDEGISFAIGTDTEPFDVSDITAVWYRRPTPPEVPAAVTRELERAIVSDEAYALLKNVYALLTNANWVSNPNSIRLASNKIRQLEVAKGFGLKVPATLVTSSPTSAKAFMVKHGNRAIMKSFLPIFYVTETGEKMPGYTTRLTEDMLSLLDNVGLCPTIIQEEIAKDYELRVTVFGSEVFAARVHTAEMAERELDWRIPTVERPLWEACTIPEWLSNKCLDILKHYGLKFGAFDFAFTPEGEYVFFEVNANGQWVWIELETVMPMTLALLRTLGYRL